MALHTLQITLGAAKTQVCATSIPCQQIMVQNNATHYCRVGDTNVSSTVGALLAAGTPGTPAPGGSVNLGPYTVACQDLRDLWIFGTQNEIIDVIYVQ